MSTTQAEFVKLLHNVPRLRQNIDKIEPETTVILCLVKDIQKAVEHYGKYCDPLPEFRVLDWEDGCLSSVSGVYGGPASALDEYIHKEKCVYGGQYIFPWPEYRQVVEMAHAIGLKTFSIDSSSDMHFKWINYVHVEKHIINENMQTLVKLYNLLEDNDSKYAFLAALKARLTGKNDFFCPSPYPQYHHPCVPLCTDDVIIDAGIGELIGPSIEFSRIVGLEGRVLGFEPDPTSFKKAVKNLHSYSNITVENLGLWKESCEANFVVTGDDGAHLGVSTVEQTVKCRLTDLDSYFETHKDLICNFIKMDIEGAELAALHGAEQTLRKWRPKLAISVYHRPFDQIFTIFNYLSDLDLGYKFYMGHHECYFTDTILYAIDGGISDIQTVTEYASGKAQEMAKMLFPVARCRGNA